MSSDSDSEKSGLLSENTRRVYEKDLHQDTFRLSARIPSEEVEHGDMVRITVEKLGESEYDR